ncbi:MAG: hypothetical protein ACFFDP_06140 [Promethearchaeota archaeon]
MEGSSRIRCAHCSSVFSFI